MLHFAYRRYITLILTRLDMVRARLQKRQLTGNSSSLNRRIRMPGTPSILSMNMHGMAQAASGWDTAGAILLLLWAVTMWAAVGGLWYASRGTPRPWLYRASLTVIVIGVIGQIGHLTEHVAQVGYWFQHPNDKAWMTPWGTALARGFGRVDPTKPTLGMEILHLTGNFIFLAGIAGIMVITRRA